MEPSQPKDKDTSLTSPNPNPPPEDSSHSVSKIQSLASDAASVDSGTQLFKPEIKIKRGRGRPPKNAKPAESASQPTEAGVVQPPPLISSEEIVEPAVSIIDGWMQKMVDPKAAMQVDEKKGICKSLGLLLDKYAPAYVEKHGAEIMALTVIGAYGTRVYAIVKMKKEAAEAEYKRQVEAQQLNVVPRDPNPAANGHDKNPPEKTGRGYGNAFAALPKH